MTLEGIPTIPQCRAGITATYDFRKNDPEVAAMSRKSILESSGSKIVMLRRLIIKFSEMISENGKVSENVLKCPKHEIMTWYCGGILKSFEIDSSKVVNYRKWLRQVILKIKSPKTSEDLYQAIMELDKKIDIPENLLPLM